MKFGVIAGVERAEVHEHGLPVLTSTQVLVRNMACSVCTTDYQQWQGLRPHQPMNMAFGHENAGIVEQVGKDVHSIELGDRVVTDAYRPCLICCNCRKGRNASYCMNPAIDLQVVDEYGYHGLYGCSEYQIVDERYVFRVRPDTPFEQATFCEPLSTVIHGIQQLALTPGQKVLVIGGGTMGILNAQMARYCGASVVVSDISPKKLDTARALGFSHFINPSTQDVKQVLDGYFDGEPLDAIIIAVGANSAYAQALDVAAKGTRLLIFASGHPVPNWDLDPNLVHYKMLDVIGTYGCCQRDYLRAADLIGSGAIDVRPLIDERFPLEQIQDAFKAAATEGAYRVSVSLG